MEDKLTQEYPQNDKGWYKFPQDDKAFRRQWFPEEAMKHPAKANLYLEKAIIEYVSRPGERLLDPMSGSGSIMLGATMGRNVVAIEIEKNYFDTLIVPGMNKIVSLCPDAAGRIMALNGNCESFLPIPVDHVIFSPPYAAIMKKSGKMSKNDITADLYGKMGEEFTVYSNTPGNVGILNKFLYNMEMEKIYKLLAQSVHSGGTMTIIIKDYSVKDTRIYLSSWVTKVCLDIGFEMAAWFKWLPHGSPFNIIWASKGVQTVKDEDIMTFRKL